MHYLVLYLVSMLAFTQMLRYAQRRGAGVLAVSAANYVVAAALSAVILAAAWSRVASAGRWTAVALGAPAGVLFFVNLLLLLAGYEHAGVGVTTAFVAMGVIVPVLVSWSWWNEPMTGSRWCAVALLPAAMLLMRPAGNRRFTFTLKGDVVLLLAFLTLGVVGVLHKALNVYLPGAGRNLYQTSLFAAAAVCSVAYAARRRVRYDRRAAGLGTALGAVNVAATQFTLLGLGVLPAVVFFPVSASLVIACQVLVSWILWRERVTRRQVLGLAAAACIVVLANL